MPLPVISRSLKSLKIGYDVSGLRRMAKVVDSSIGPLSRCSSIMRANMAGPTSRNEEVTFGPSTPTLPIVCGPRDNVARLSFTLNRSLGCFSLINLERGLTSKAFPMSRKHCNVGKLCWHNIDVL
jgi:hypothetical protein